MSSPGKALAFSPALIRMSEEPLLVPLCKFIDSNTPLQECYAAASL